jgi:hypothetical protein
MVCVSGGSAVIVENKAWSCLHDNQLENYRQYAERNYEHYKIVLITANSTQHAQNPDKALCWRNVYDLIKNWLDQCASSDDHVIVKSFLKLIVNEGMGPLAPVSHESILYYRRAKPFIERVRALRNTLVNTYKRELESLLPNQFKCENYEEWGIIGISLLKGLWLPGIYFGVVEDERDHNVAPILGDDSPDFSIILSIDQKFHAIYEQFVSFNNLVSELNEKVPAINTGWMVYNHLQDKSIIKPNRWHPIHIRKPLLELLRGTTTQEEQAKVVFKQVESILCIIASSENFRQLQIELKKVP